LILGLSWSLATSSMAYGLIAMVDITCDGYPVCYYNKTD